MASLFFGTINHEKTLRLELQLPILLANELIKAANEANSYRSDCLNLARLAHKIRRIVQITLSSSFIYNRPIHRIATVATYNLRLGLTLVSKFKHSGLLQHVFFAFTSFVLDFEKVSGLLQSSIYDFRWLLSVFSDDNRGEEGMIKIPPIASDDPIMALVWNAIASLQINRRKHDRIEAAKFLSLVARSNYRYRKVIVEEGAVLPLLQLLEGNGGCSEGQVVAALALYWLTENISINNDEVISIIVKVLGESDMRVQIVVAELVAKIAQVDVVARDEFARENVVEALFSCLNYDLDMEEYNKFHSSGGKTSLSLHPAFQTAKSRNYNYFDGNCSTSYSKKDREEVSSENKHKLKINCALALWRLCENSLLNCQKIVEPKNLFCLAKVIETENAELRFNCLMTVMQVAVVTEGNADFRKAVWKPSFQPVKAVLEQLLTVIQEETSPKFLIPAIKTLGCLARILSSKETKVVGALVEKLENEYLSVVSEAVTGLTKFTCPDNHNCIEHSRTIIEFNSVPLLMKLLSDCEGVKLDGVVLLCYLSMNVPNSEALAEARALNALESVFYSGIARKSHLRDLIYRAINRLVSYQDGPHPSSLDLSSHESFRE